MRTTQGVHDNIMPKITASIVVTGALLGLSTALIRQVSILRLNGMMTSILHAAVQSPACLPKKRSIPVSSGPPLHGHRPQRYRPSNGLLRSVPVPDLQHR